MKFQTILAVAFAAITASAVAVPGPIRLANVDVKPVEPVGPVKPPKTPCDSKLHPCNLYHREKHCSPEYIKLLKACVASGCIQWVRDPLADCYKPVKPVKPELAVA